MPKRAQDEAQGSTGKRPRRRAPHSAEAASDQGGVVALNDAWSWLKKADGQEGVGYLLGEAAVLRYAAGQTAAGRGDGGSGRPTASSPSMAGSRRGCGRGGGGGRDSGRGVATAPFLGRLKAPWLQLVSRRLTCQSGSSSEDIPDDVVEGIPE
ncbi:hypothetical protein PC123_g23966 [Phytophthora cactorum]|nr:hypothetical protein PC123_g23966 [Phytophthora cactorum]